MAEETDNAESGGENAIANSLALSGASRAKADAFLDDQRHHLKEQIKHLDLGIWEKRIGVALQAGDAVRRPGRRRRAGRDGVGRRQQQGPDHRALLRAPATWPGAA